MTNLRRVAIWVLTVMLAPSCNDPTVGPAKGNFDLITPANGAIGVMATPTFVWQASFSVETPTYTIQVATDPGFATLIVNTPGLTTTSFTPASALSSGTVYYWQVLAVRSTGSVVSTGAPFSFTTFAATPGPFTMMSPTNPTTNGSLTPTFSWNASAGAATYTLQVALATDTSFSSPVVNQAGLPSTSFPLTTALAASTAYIWQVIAVSTNSTTASNAPFAYTTGAGSATSVTLISPTDGATGVGQTPTFTWSTSGSPAPATYTIQVTLTTDPTFMSPVINQTGLPTASFTVPTSSPLSATTTHYSWRVEAVNSSSTVIATSPVFTFTAP